MTNMKLNVTSAHNSATVSSVISLIALVHPGFHINPAVQAICASVFGLIGGIIELVHLRTHRTLAQNIAFAEAQVKLAAVQATTAKPAA